MPLFLVERTFAERVDLSVGELRALEGESRSMGLRWIESFLSADRLQSYCLFEAPSVEAILSASEQMGMPVDAVIEVTGVFDALAAGGAAAG